MDRKEKQLEILVQTWLVGEERGDKGEKITNLVDGVEMVVEGLTPTTIPEALLSSFSNVPAPRHPKLPEATLVL